jgi:predicted transport protein
MYLENFKTYILATRGMTNHMIRDDNLINNKLLFHDHKNISNWGKSDVNVIIGHNTCHYLISRLP